MKNKIILISMIITIVLAMAGAVSAQCTLGGVEACWPLDGNADDISGNGHHGAVFGATSVAGQIGTAFDFDGTDDYINPNFAPNLLAGQGFALNMWFKTTTTANGDIEYLYASDTSGTPSDSYIFVAFDTFQCAPGEIFIGVNDNDDPEWGSCSFCTANIFNDGLWHNLILNSAEAAGIRTLYIDGQEEGYCPITADTSGPKDFTGYPPYIAAMNHVNLDDRHFDGAVDDVAFFGRSLTNEEITAIYNEGLTGVGVCDVVISSNNPPVADIGADMYYGVVGLDLGGPLVDYVIDASGSTDSDGTITNYQLTCSTPLDSNTVIYSGGNPVVAVPYSTWSVCGGEIGDEFILTLTVTDDDGDTGTDTALVKVEEEVIASVFANIAITGEEGGSVSLNDASTLSPEVFVNGGFTDLMVTPALKSCTLTDADVTVNAATGETVITGGSGECEINMDEADYIRLWEELLAEMRNLNYHAEDLGEQDVEYDFSPTHTDILPLDMLDIECTARDVVQGETAKCDIVSFSAKGTKLETTLVSGTSIPVLNWAWRDRSVLMTSGIMYDVVQGGISPNGYQQIDSADIIVSSANNGGVFSGPAGFARDHDATWGQPVTLECGDVISASGTYTLTQDLHCSGDGLMITSPGVTLDCVGYTLYGPGYGSNTAIRAVKVPGVTIKNCNMRDWGLGIAIKDSNNSLVSNIVVENTVMAVHVNPSFFVTIKNLVAKSVQNIVTAIDSAVDLDNVKGEKTDKEVPPDADEPEEVEPIHGAEPGMVVYITSNMPFEKIVTSSDVELEPMPGQECIGIYVDEYYTLNIQNSNVKKLTTGIKVNAGGTVNAGPNVAFCGNSLIDIDNSGTFNVAAPVYATNTVGVAGTESCTYAPATEEIGTDGGIITTFGFGTTDGVEVNVPSGALDTKTLLSASVQKGTGIFSLEGISGEQIFSFNLGPEGTNFAVPATATVSYNDAGMDLIYEQDLVIGYNDPTTGEWMIVDAFHNIGADTFTFQTTHFSEYGLFKLNYPNTIAVHADTHTVGTGSKPAASKSPTVGLFLNLYDRSSGSCAADYSASWQNYPDIVDNCVPLMTRVTDSNGNANLGVLDFSDYVIIGANGEDKHLGTPVTVDSTYTQKYLQQIIKADGKKVAAKRTKYTGSEIEIVEPEYIIWNSTEEAYPYIMESQDSWGVEVSITPPEGYVADYDNLTETTPEYKAVQFTVSEVGSVPDGTDVEMMLTDHKGKKQKHKSKTGIKLSRALAKAKGIKVDNYGVLTAQKRARGRALGLTGMFGADLTEGQLSLTLLVLVLGAVVIYCIHRGHKKKK